MTGWWFPVGSNRWKTKERERGRAGDYLITGQDRTGRDGTGQGSRRINEWKEGRKEGRDETTREMTCRRGERERRREREEKEEKELAINIVQHGRDK